MSEQDFNQREVRTQRKVSDYDGIPEEYKPISMWGYFGYEILFSIPVIGLILLIVFALGGSANKNVRNFARSYFCYYIIIAVVLLIAVILLFALGGSAVILESLQ